MGDLAVGDLVFGRDGRPCRVEHAYLIDLAPESFRLTFDDGETITACADHLWLTFDAGELGALTRRDPAWREARRARRPSRATGRRSQRFTAAVTARNQRLRPPEKDSPTGTVRSTAQIAATLTTPTGRRNHAIPVAGALHLPDVDLPLDPYLLGLWLGDGSTNAGVITTADPDLAAAFEAGGFDVAKLKSKYAYGIHGLATVLRRMGCFGNKHVPLAYLRGSRAQRLALLQGLMDTDGCSYPSGSVEFTSTNRALALAAHELAVSLGHKAAISEGRATLYGKDCGPKFRICWRPSEPVFRLERKRARQVLEGRRTTRFRYIVACERVDPVPMRCIRVDAPDGLFLAGRHMVPTHNSAALLVDAIRYVGRGYGANYRALLLRREFPDLKKSLIVESRKLYPRLGGRYNENDKVWKFPGGELVWFGHAQHEKDIEQYQGAAFQFIGFDEVNTFTQRQYLYLFSRCRSAHGVPCRIRATCNPGGVGHDFIRRRFWPWLGLPPEERRNGEGEPFAHGGEVLYFLRQHDEERRISRDEARELRRQREAASIEEREDLPMPIGRTFVPAKLADNPFLAADGAYRRGLQELDPVTRARLENGDWDVKEARGTLFQRGWFDIIDAPPAEVLGRIRYWDRAASPEPKPGESDDPDWTAGGKVSVTREGVFIVEHMAHFRAGPGEVRRQVRTTAEQDGRGTVVGVEIDPGQAGKVEAADLISYLAGFEIYTTRPAKGQDKVTRAKPASAQASPPAKNIKLVRGPWNDALLDELEGFPDKGWKDDQVDALSGAVNYLIQVLITARARGETTVANTDEAEREQRIAEYSATLQELQRTRFGTPERLQLADVLRGLQRSMTPEEIDEAKRLAKGDEREESPRRDVKRR